MCFYVLYSGCACDFQLSPSLFPSYVRSSVIPPLRSFRCSFLLRFPTFFPSVLLNLSSSFFSSSFIFLFLLRSCCLFFFTISSSFSFFLLHSSLLLHFYCLMTSFRPVVPSTCVSLPFLSKHVQPAPICLKQTKSNCANPPSSFWSLGLAPPKPVWRSLLLDL